MRRARAAAAIAVALFVARPQTADRARRIDYADLCAALQERFARAGVDADRFAAYLRDVETETGRRGAEGEREQLIYYALQSRRFTAAAPIEPALSARQFVDTLPLADRARLIDDPTYLPAAGWPSAEKARVEELLRTLRVPAAGDTRVDYFKHLTPMPTGETALDAQALYADYVRVARFLYKKEFGAGAADAGRVAQLYQTRPHSSDTQIEAGFGVYTGLGALHALDPALRVSRVLVVGPGLDVAPRTGLIDITGPQSYQPAAIADALLALSLASDRDLRVHAVDVNPA